METICVETVLSGDRLTDGRINIPGFEMFLMVTYPDM